MLLGLGVMAVAGLGTRLKRNQDAQVDHPVKFLTSGQLNFPEF